MGLRCSKVRRIAANAPCEIIFASAGVRWMPSSPSSRKWQPATRSHRIMHPLQVSPASTPKNSIDPNVAISDHREHVPKCTQQHFLFRKRPEPRDADHLRSWLARTCDELAPSASRLRCTRLQGDRTGSARPWKVVALQHARRLCPARNCCRHDRAARLPRRGKGDLGGARG